MLTQLDLDRFASQGCADPRCNCNEGPMYLHPKCHSAGIEASYESGSGVLVISCVECHKVIAEIAVAE